MFFISGRQHDGMERRRHHVQAVLLPQLRHDGHPLLHPRLSLALPLLLVQEARGVRHRRWTNNR